MLMVGNATVSVRNVPNSVRNAPKFCTERTQILYGTHLFVPSSVGFHIEQGTNKCVPYRQNGNPTELGTNKCVPYRQNGNPTEQGTNKCVPYRQNGNPTEL